jgi:translation initiation factor 5B
MEVALAIEGVTVGRQLDVEEILYVDIPETHAKELRKMELTPDEADCLDKVCFIHARERAFWGK